MRLPVFLPDGGGANGQFGIEDPGLIFGNGVLAFYNLDEHFHGDLSHFKSRLSYAAERRMEDLGQEGIGEADDAHLFWYFNLSFGQCLEAAGGQLVTGSYDGVGLLLQVQQGIHRLFRLAIDQSSIGAVFDEGFVEGNMVIGQGCLIASQPFFGNGKVGGDGYVGDPFESGFDQVFGGLVGSVKIVGAYFMGLHFFGDPVEEYDGKAFIVQFIEMREVGGFRGQGDEESIDGAGGQVLRIGYFSFIGFMALGDDDVIAFFISDGLDAVDDLGEEVIGYFADNDADGAASFFFQALSDGVRPVVELICIIHDQLLCFGADLVAAPEGPGDGRSGEAQCFGDILYGNSFEFHGRAVVVEGLFSLFA
jgi:hypothetical protein